MLFGSRVPAAARGGSRRYQLLALLAATVLSAWVRADTSELSFVAIGDTPYSDAERRRIEDHVAPAIAASGAPFLVHYGDFNRGGAPCAGDVASLAEVRDWVLALHAGPVFYTPGDNDWTDCDRGAQGVAISELDALTRLRVVFFDAPALPAGEHARWAFARQPGYPENARWEYDGVLFVTLHVVGTNNGRSDVRVDDGDVARLRVEARDRANVDWLGGAFAAGRGARALVVSMQADVTRPGGGGACTANNAEHCDAFAALRGQLSAFASGFRNAFDKPLKPVLVLHGDTQPYCMDRYFGGRRAPNLWRLNAWGDFRSPADATLVTVRHDDAEQPFVARTLLGGVAPEPAC